MTGLLLKQICSLEEVNGKLLDDDMDQLTGHIQNDIHRINEIKKYLEYYANICGHAMRRLEILNNEGDGKTENIREDYDRALKLGDKN